MRWLHAGSVIVAAGWGAAAMADDLTVSSAQTTTVNTATAANNSPGNVTIAAGGSVNVTSGAAVTINSANTLTNSGSLTNTGVTNSFGVVITTPGPFTLTNNAPITLSGTAGSGDIGIALTGPATTGTIAFGIGGSLSVAADSAIGVSLAAPLTGTVGVRSITLTGATSTVLSLTAPLTGSLNFAGASSATTAGSAGVLIAAPVSGTVTNGGSLTVGSTRGTSATTGLIVAGNQGLYGVRVSANVGGGFVNDRYYIDATGAVVPAASVDTTVDTLITGTVITGGTAPALWVAPDPTVGQPITVGAVGTGIDAFAIDNRGILETNIVDDKVASTTVRIGGGGATTTLTGGIANQTSASIIANTLDARATAIDLQAGAVVPQLVNAGTIAATAVLLPATSTTAAGTGGPAVGVLVEPGASLPSIVNSGSITVTSSGTNPATAILDQSSSVTSIVNTSTGAITAKGPTSTTLRAIDLSAGTGAVTIVNSGTITGDVVLGQGPTAVYLTGGSVSGAIVYGTSAANSLSLSGTGALSGGLTTPTPIAVSLTDTSRLSLVGGPGTVASVATSGASVLTVPVLGSAPALTVTGAASFTGTSTIALSLQSLAVSQNITVVTAGGGITTDHLPTLVDATSAPYLFTATAPVLTPTTLSIGLTRKTAAQVGLTGGQAALFDASIPAFANSPAEAAAIANLPDAGSVAAAYRGITPPSFGRAQLRVAQAVADTGFAAAGERLAVLTDRGRSRPTDDPIGIGLWAQQYGDFERQGAGPNEDTFTTSTFGIAGGVDTTRFLHSVIGIGFVSDFATIHHDGVGTSPGFNVPATTTGVEPYVAFSPFKPIFIEATGLYARVSYSAIRTLAIGPLTDTVTSYWRATQYGAGVNVGARINFGHFRLTPSNSLSWTMLKQDAYTEQGAGAFALQVGKQSDSVTTDTAKLAFALLHPMGDGLLKLEVHGAYTKQFNLKPTDTVANFVSGVGSISLPGDTVRSDEYSYGVDLGYTQDTIALRGGYDRREATNFRDQAVAVSATIGF